MRLGDELRQYGDMPFSSEGVSMNRSGKILATLALFVQLLSAQAMETDNLWNMLKENGADQYGVLTSERLEESLATIEEAGAWPNAWLIVQVASLDEDLVMHLTRSEKEGTVTLEEHFMAPRTEWNAAALKNAYREVTGKKLRSRSVNIVIQGFSTRTVTAWVYDSVGTVDVQAGLMALLPEGSILREARSIDLGDGRPHTLAVVLVDPRFRPADCSGCRGRTFGHSDTGDVRLVLAGEREVEDALDITPYLSGYGEEPLLPRFVCMEGDPAMEPDSNTVRSWFAHRTPVKLLDFVDFDGDGRPQEIILPAAYIECGRVGELVVGIDPVSGKIRTY